MLGIRQPDDVHILVKPHHDRKNAPALKVF